MVPFFSEKKNGIQATKCHEVFFSPFLCHFNIIFIRRKIKTVARTTTRQPSISPLYYYHHWVLRRIFGPKRAGLTGEWKKLHNEELNDMYSSPNIVRVIKWRRMRWAGHVAHMEEVKGVHKLLVGKPEGKGRLGRPRCRWEDNIKMDLQEVGWGLWGLDGVGSG
jgi:hypothetical protein